MAASVWTSETRLRDATRLSVSTIGQRSQNVCWPRRGIAVWKKMYRINAKKTGQTNRRTDGQTDTRPLLLAYALRFQCFDAVGWAAGRASGL